MPEIIKEISTPRGLGRLAFRAPIWLYGLGLGWMLGERFLLLTHTGRKSGLLRKTVLEVVRHDNTSGVTYVASGFGEKSDWYRNVMKEPRVWVQCGRKPGYEALAERSQPDDAELVLLDYARRHPTAMRELARFMGYRLDGSEADIRALGRMLPIIALRPIKPPVES